MNEERVESEVPFDPELFRPPLRAVFLDETDLAAAAALRAWSRLTLPVLVDLAIDRCAIGLVNRANDVVKSNRLQVRLTPSSAASDRIDGHIRNRFSVKWTGAHTCSIARALVCCNVR